ncbi:maleylpyruvate isomerase family mycothiol-dependent enzyme [Nocardia sp. NPDC057353]|uniref:maleylpyruvate isomerase family mycothiol-dependent enzyme n=1 Tax=Nocardia sp. NPDC057353 TaxID=3346104 RepID=UPI0036253674
MAASVVVEPDVAWRIIAEQRRAIAELLAGLAQAEWDRPSLCAGWRIREVAAHVAVTPDPPPLGVILATAVRAGGNYNRMVDRLTRRSSGRPTDEIVASLRAHADSRRLPALTNYRNILMDTLVHGQDMAIPLGRALRVDPEAAAAAAAHAVTVGRPVFDPHRLDGIGLCADDAGWRHGAGPEIRGPALALLLAITGRTARLDELSGPGVALLAARLS